MRAVWVVGVGKWVGGWVVVVEEAEDEGGWASGRGEGGGPRRCAKGQGATRGGGQGREARCVWLRGCVWMGLEVEVEEEEEKDVVLGGRKGRGGGGGKKWDGGPKGVADGPGVRGECVCVWWVVP